MAALIECNPSSRVRVGQRQLTGTRSIGWMHGMSWKAAMYEKVSRDHQVATGGRIIGVRCVDVNKGNAQDVNYRSRLVGREFNVGRDDALYAFTPPLEALSLIVSYAATH